MNQTLVYCDKRYKDISNARFLNSVIAFIYMTEQFGNLLVL